MSSDVSQADDVAVPGWPKQFHDDACKLLGGVSTHAMLADAAREVVEVLVSTFAILFSFAFLMPLSPSTLSR